MILIFMLVRETHSDVSTRSRYTDECVTVSHHIFHDAAPPEYRIASQAPRFHPRDLRLQLDWMNTDADVAPARLTSPFLPSVLLTTTLTFLC